MTQLFSLWRQHNILIPLGLAAADTAIHKKMFGSGPPSDLDSCNTKLIISNEEMNDVMKIIKSFEESGLLIKGISETIINEAKKKNGWFLGMLLGTLGASLLGNLSTDKVTIRAGEGTIRTDQDF